jgi:thioredoxin 2
MRVLKLSVLLILAAVAFESLACPGCKDALSTGSSVTNPWGAAFNTSIMFMLAIVLSMAGGLVYFIYRLSRAEEQKHGAAASTQAAAVAPQRRWSWLALPIFAVLYIGIFAWVDAHESASRLTVTIPALNDETFRSATRINPYLLVEFSAAWCPGCKTTEPEYGRFIQSPPQDLKCYALDTDKSPVTAKALEVDTLPCMILFREGKELARHTGIISEGQLREWVEQHSKP